MVRFLQILACCLCAAAACAGSDLSERLFKAGERAEKAGDSMHAYLLYSRAAALEPANPVYAARKAAVRAAAEISSEARLGPDPALEPSLDVGVDGEVEPETSAAEPLNGREMLEAREALPPPRLEASAAKMSFNLKGDARTIFEKVAEAYGLLVVFEADYQSPPPFTFRMTDVGYVEALHALELVSSSFMVPVNPRLAIVVRDTPQKRGDMGQAISVAIPIPERLSAQDAQEIIAAVQQTLDIRRITTDPTRHLVFVRDQVAKVAAAQQIFANLSRMRPQIEIEVEFLSVGKTSSLNYGVNAPTQIPLVNFGNFMNNTPSIPAGFTKFLTFGGGTTLFGLGVTDALAFATLTRADSVNTLRAQMAAMDGQAATLHVGDKYPIITNGYYGTATGTGQVYSPPPTVNFTDLGLVLKVTPSIHDGGEVTLDIDAAFSILGTGSSISGIPVISSRKYAGKVRLGNGEWAVLAGLVQTTDSVSRTGTAGLMNIPLIGHFFSQDTREHDSTQVLLVLKPRLVTMAPWEYVTRQIWLGTETRPITMY